MLLIVRYDWKIYGKFSNPYWELTATLMLEFNINFLPIKVGLSSLGLSMQYISDPTTMEWETRYEIQGTVQIHKYYFMISDKY